MRANVDGNLKDGVTLEDNTQYRAQDMSRRMPALSYASDENPPACRWEP